MLGQYHGEIYALLTAVTWAFALVLFKRTGEQVAPLPLNLFKNIVSLALLGITLLAMASRFGELHAFPREDIYIMVFSGVVGIALADTAFFAALNRLGVGVVSIVDCLYSPFTVLSAWILLGERLSFYHYVGGGLILCGVLLSSRHPPPPGRTSGQIVSGVALGALAMGLMGFGIVLAKPVLEADDFPLIWAATIRLAAGTVFLPFLAIASPRRTEYMRAFKPSRTWLISIPASILGSYLAYVFWIAGFKYAKASIVCLLNQTSTIFAIALAALLLNERFTRRKLLAVSLAIAGIVIIVTMTNGRAGS